MLLTAAVERFGKVEVSQHRVRNLSERGACIDRAEAFRKGETLVVSVGALMAVSATVRWAEDGHAGLQFCQPIDLDAAREKAAIRPRRTPASTTFRPLLAKTHSKTR